MKFIDVTNIVFVMIMNLKHLKYLYKQITRLITYEVKRRIPTVLGSSFIGHDKRKRQILIVGYYGDGNFGDELMLKILIDRFRCGSVEISVVFTESYDYMYSQWDGIFPYVAPKTEVHLEKAADFFDEVILGGGAHIDDTLVHSYSFTPKLICDLTKLMLNRDKVVKWIGVSTSTKLTRNSYICDLKNIAGKITEFSVRDSYSLNLLKGLGVDIKHLTLTNDIAYGIDVTKKILCVTLINYFNDEEKLICIVQDIVRFITQSSVRYVICFLPFYIKNSNDLDLIYSIVEKVDFKGVEYFVAPEYENVDSMLLMIKGCDLFVNMRYHASLISMMYGKKTISIVYEKHPHYYNKMTYLHESLKKERWLIYFKDCKVGSVFQKLNDISQ